jgi:hypothetical protein
LARLAQRRGFRAYLEGVLLPRDRNKTLTSLVGSEPVVGAQHAAVQGLQWFLTEATWDHERVNQRRVELLLGDPATAPNDQGALVLDDSGDRKAGRHTAHLARQWLGSLGKTDNGIVGVSSLWADEGVDWPIDVVPPRQRRGCPGASATRRSGPSRSWLPSSSRPLARPGSASARWSPTAWTATTRASPRRSDRRRSPMC